MLDVSTQVSILKLRFLFDYSTITMTDIGTMSSHQHELCFNSTQWIYGQSDVIRRNTEYCLSPDIRSSERGYENILENPSETNLWLSYIAILLVKLVGKSDQCLFLTSFVFNWRILWPVYVNSNPARSCDLYPALSCSQMHFGALE